MNNNNNDNNDDDNNNNNNDNKTMTRPSLVAGLQGQAALDGSGKTRPASIDPADTH